MTRVTPRDRKALRLIFHTALASEGDPSCVSATPDNTYLTITADRPRLPTPHVTHQEVALKAFWMYASGLAMVVALAILLTGSDRALADASGHASCFGIEASSVSPPGSSGEEPGGMAQLAHELKEFGGPPGGIVSCISHLHAGSHDACDEAIGG